MLARLANVRVVDLNCGSGILPLAYNDLREIEFDVLSEIKSHRGSAYIEGYKSLIDLNNFCGVQDDPVVHQMAKLSIWLTDFNMNIKFNKELGVPYHLFPLQALPHIVNDDAMAMSSWEQFSDKKLETYIIVNLINEHIDDVYDWIQRGADEINGHHMEFAFSASDTVCQGNSVNTMWVDALDGEVEIRFACESFNWDGMRNAVVVGLSEDRSKDKFIVSSEGTHKVSSINAYLFESSAFGVVKEKTPQFSLPPLVEGCKRDCSYNMILSLKDKKDLIKKHPESKTYIKQYLTSKNLYGEDIEYCLLMNDIADTKSGLGMRLILDSDMGPSEVKQFVDNPSYQNAPSIVIPKSFSTVFNHIPLIAVGSETVSNASNYVLYNPERWTFALLSSRMHQEWVKSVGAQSDKFIGYSHERCYNTFPVPELTDGHKSTLGLFANNIIRARSMSVESLDIMYHPESMHCELKQAHAELDDYIDNLYLRVTDRKRRITANLDRVSILFKMISMHQEGKKLRAQEVFDNVTQELTEMAQLLRV